MNFKGLLTTYRHIRTNKKRKTNKLRNKGGEIEGKTKTNKKKPEDSTDLE